MLNYYITPRYEYTDLLWMIGVAWETHNYYNYQACIELDLPQWIVK